MSDKNYELYKKNKVDIFNMAFDAWERAMLSPDKDKVLQDERDKIRQELIDLGFELKQPN